MSFESPFVLLLACLSDREQVESIRVIVFADDCDVILILWRLKSSINSPM
jgi:hypothetical protein